jgi:streptogramin lyase
VATLREPRDRWLGARNLHRAGGGDGGGQTFILVANGAPGTGANTLYQVTNGTVRALADIAAYQRTDPDPYDLDDPPFPEESNPFGVAALQDGSALVADAAANDLLRVSTRTARS